MINPAWPIINQTVCDIYGLDSRDVVWVHIDMEPSEIPSVTVGLRTNEGLAWLVLNVLQGKVMGDLNGETFTESRIR